MGKECKDMNAGRYKRRAITEWFLRKGRRTVSQLKVVVGELVTNLVCIDNFVYGIQRQRLWSNKMVSYQNVGSAE